VAAQGDAWTPEQAAQLLDPPMDVREVRAMIALLGVPARGLLRSGYAGGRPPRTYGVDDLLTAHAIVIHARIQFL